MLQYVMELDPEALYYAHCVTKHVNIKSFKNLVYFLELPIYLIIHPLYFLQYLCRFGVCQYNQLLNQLNA